MIAKSSSLVKSLPPKTLAEESRYKSHWLLDEVANQKENTILVKVIDDRHCPNDEKKQNKKTMQMISNYPLILNIGQQVSAVAINPFSVSNSPNITQFHNRRDPSL